MSDRRAVSAGHLGASSVAAANETWRVAVGGNRVESMTVDQIAQAFHAGHLNVRTPLWQPGTTGWQALGNFGEFQAPPAAYGGGHYDSPNGLAQFEEADDDPTRMWTGAGDDLPGMDAMQPPPPPMEQRPSARTGPRQVSRPVPSPPMAPPVPSRPAAPPPPQAAAAAWPAPPPAPSLASRTPALVPTGAPPRQNRGNGLMLVAGLVGLVGLGSAVLAARGNLSGSAAEPAPTSPEVAAEAAPAAEPVAEVRVPKTVSGEAQLAKYDDPSAQASASAFVAGSPAKAAAAETPAVEKPAEAAPSEKKVEDQPVAEAAAEERAPETKKHAKASEKAEAEKPEKAAKSSRSRSEHSEEVALKRTASRATPKRAAALPRQKPVALARVEKAEKLEKPEKAEKLEKAEKPEKAEKAEASEAAAPANAAVNEAAAAALASSANLAASCRPRGGPAGAGKARVIYSNDGEVQSVEILTAKFRDTLTGSCVRMVFRRAKIPAFKGEPPTFIKSFTIPEE